MDVGVEAGGSTAIGATIIMIVECAGATIILLPVEMKCVLGFWLSLFGGWRVGG